MTKQEKNKTRRLFRRHSLQRTLLTLFTIGGLMLSLAGGVKLKAAVGDVKISEFTVASSAAATQSDTSTTYNTYTGNNEQLTVRGSYSLNKDCTATNPVTISVYMQYMDAELYFAANDRHYFTLDNNNVTWPTGSGNHQITHDDNGVTLSFTVFGNQGASGNFTIGYSFDKRYAGWIPDGKLLANIRTEGDADLPNLRQVYAKVEERPGRLTFSSSNSEVGVNQDCYLSLALTHEIGTALRWLLEPGTDFKMELTYPTDALVTIPAPRLGNPVPEVSIPGKTTWDFGQAGANGLPINWSLFSSQANSYSYSYTAPGGQIKVVFPSSHFSNGDEVTITAKLIFTSAGNTVPTVVPLSLTFHIVGPFIHMKPFTLDITSTFAAQPVVIDIDGSTTVPATQHHSLNTEVATNGGTLPIPNVCLSFFNGVSGSGKANNIVRIAIINSGATFQTNLVFTIRNMSTGTTRTVNYTAAAALTVGGTSAITNFPTLLSLQPTEYIERIDAYPRNAGADALPVGAGIRLQIGYAAWSGGVFPNGATINDHDYVVVSSRVSWTGESMPELHGSLSDNIIQNSAITDQARVYYGASPIWPQVSFAYQSGEDGPKSPGSNVGLDLRVSQGRDAYEGIWENPIVYYLPPSYIEFDPAQPLVVRDGTTGDIVAGTSATVVTVTLVDPISLTPKTAYKISITGTPAVKVPVNTRYLYIPIVLKVKDNTLPGNYYFYHATDINQGLLFGTMTKAYSIIYGFRSTGVLFNDLGNFDNNPSTHLVTTNSSSLRVSALSKMDVESQMYNNIIGGVWQNVNDLGAEATVAMDGSGEGHFRQIITNSGNTYIGNIRILDILPYQGLDEASVINPTSAKPSQWAATLKQALIIKIYDESDNDVTSSFSGYSIQYCTNGNPSYSGGVGTSAIQRTGVGNFANDANYSTAKSFLFDSGTLRLPPGYKLVIEGVICPSGLLTAADEGLVAYNSFASQAEYFQNSSGGTPSAAGVFEPTRQKFTLKDMGDSSVRGLVFKDLNGNNVYDDTIDAPYAGVVVEIWKADQLTGLPSGLSAVAITSTDVDGLYEFSNLAHDFYIIRFIKPEGSPYDPYSFATKGSDTVATASHAESDGYSSMFELLMNAAKVVPVNAGIKAAGQVAVRFYTMPTNATVGVIANVSILISEADIAVSNDIVLGIHAFIPPGYQLVSGETDTKSCSLSWSDATDLVEFEVELMPTYGVTYAANWPLGTGIGTVPIDNDDYLSGSEVPVAANPGSLALTGYTFLGWDRDYTVTSPTHLVSGTSVIPPSFTMGADDVTLFAIWSKDPTYTVTYDANWPSLSGSSGTVPTDTNEYLFGDTLGVQANPGSLAIIGYNFLGWATSDTAMVPEHAVSGTTVIPPTRLIGNSDLVLYAVWADAATLTVTYYPNWPKGVAGLGMITDTNHYAPGDTVTVADNSGIMTKSGYAFVGWNDTPDGSGTSYAPLSTFTIGDNVSLYAQWQLLGGNPDNPKTGDASNGIFWLFTVLSLTSTVFCMSLVDKKKKKSL